MYGVSNILGQKMTSRIKDIEMALRITYELIVFNDLGVLVGHELHIGQIHIKTASCSVLTRWQPTKLTYLVGSNFEVYKDCPRAFWLS